MQRLLFSLLLVFATGITFAQKGTITPQQLIELNRVGGMGISEDGKTLYYSVTKVDVANNSKTTRFFSMALPNGKALEIADAASIQLPDHNISPDGSKRIVVESVKLGKVSGTDFYPEMKQSNVQIYSSLNYRHWDTWEDGSYNHLILENINGSKNRIDLLSEEAYDCPTQPFGGEEDYLWSPDGKYIIYVCKKKFGTDYAVSTNTDIYQYEVATGKTTNLTQGNLGYDTQPAFSSQGQLAWLQMRRDGYESDKNDIVVMMGNSPINLTAAWDGTVNSFRWSTDGRKIFFVAPIGGTEQLFSIDLPLMNRSGDDEALFTATKPRQITNGQFDVTGIVGQSGNMLVVSRTDMNHATELFTVELKAGSMTQITHENDAFYNSIALPKVEKRIVKTTDGKDMVTWVIYPPNFDPNKKYPTLLYCQGGPQGALSQFYSYRWNFQLMASQGYIVVAPNRRGMPGHGVEWNEQISQDYGGQNMKDYLSAIDDVSKESYVDKTRIGAVGASYGGYSVFYLAGNHDKRFRTFIAHDGIFNWKSMYGTTEELFFVNWDLGGSYWDKSNPNAVKAYTSFNPVEHVAKWDTPILIIQGGKDFRVPIGQGLEAFQAAQLQGVKSKLLYFPEENHWVLDYQNSLIWHTEFYKWLAETMPPKDR